MCNQSAAIVFYMSTLFLNLGMDESMDGNRDVLHGSVTYDDDDISSWVSVCPSGLWNVQQKRLRGIQGVVSTCGSGYFLPCPFILSMLGIEKLILCYFSLFSLGISSDCPRLGSLCQVRLRLKAQDEADDLVSEWGNEESSVQCEQLFSEIKEATAFARCQDSVLQVPVGDWTTIRFGEGQCDITEACVERMRAGETCEVRLIVIKLVTF